MCRISKFRISTRSSPSSCLNGGFNSFPTFSQAHWRFAATWQCHTTASGAWPAQICAKVNRFGCARFLAFRNYCRIESSGGLTCLTSRRFFYTGQIVTKMLSDCGSGSCHASSSPQLASTAATTGPSRIVYVGDGSNDFCAALHLRHGDVVLARAGYRLEKLLREDGESSGLKAAFRTWGSYAELSSHLRDLFALE